MAEAEDVVTDVARHATVFARDLWRRHRDRDGVLPTLALADVAARIDLLITGVFGASYPIRVAQAPARPTLLTAVFGRRRGPVLRQAIPATDGASLWLPRDLGSTDPELALERFRTMALQQAMRAERGSAEMLARPATALHRDLYLLVEAFAADEALVRILPGVAASINGLRTAALAARPLMSAFPKHLRRLETFLRILLRSDCREPADPTLRSASPADSVLAAERLVANLMPLGLATRLKSASPLLKDAWTGVLLPPAAGMECESALEFADVDDDGATAPRSARLERRPEVREAADDEDCEPTESGAWMVQAEEPHEKAEDPMGLQRPTDRDDAGNAGELAEMLSELPEARTVSTPERPKEVLLSDDPPTGARITPGVGENRDEDLTFPEWDYRAQSYRMPGATVRRLPPERGPQAWVDDTLQKHRSMLEGIRRRFEMLRATRTVLRKQRDGDEIDFESVVDALADLRAGGQMPEGLYRHSRPAERNMAIMLLIDVSGSTDGWVSSNRRVIDVEREALLLVCIALQEMGEPYAVQAFSGKGPHAVSLRPIKGFNEPFGDEIALRIAALEPEQYTRAGAALRHATADLMRQPAHHRLLMLLSDGRPNDIDEYEGRYGVEDLREAVVEARLQGIFPFCLTIDRQAANYLPRVFGANQYAMLPDPQLLPTVLLDWMRRLLAA